MSSLSATIATPLALALWLCGIIAIFVDHPWLFIARLALLCAFMAAALFYASGLTRSVFTVAAAAIAIYAVFGNPGPPVVEGLRFSLVLTIFLPALILIREVVDVSPEMHRARQAFAALTTQQRGTGLIIGGQVLGVVVTLGALALAAPLIARDTPLSERIATAVALLRGISLCVLWSPFTVGVAFVLSTKPEVQLYEVLAAGFAIAVIGTIIGVWMYSGWRGLRTFMEPLRAFHSLYAPIGALIVAVVVFAQITPFSSLQSVSMLMPIICLVRLLTMQPTAISGVFKATWSTLAATANEILLFSSAVILGQLITTAGLAQQSIDWLSLDSMSDGAFLALLMLLGPALALTGMHSVLIGAVIAALLAPLDARYPDLVEAMVILYAWMTASSISVGSLSVGVATRLFDVDARQLVLSSNLVYTIALTVIVTVGFEIFLLIR